MESVDLSDGEPFSVFWELSQNDSFVSTGAVTPVAESWSKMYVQKYAAPKNEATVWPEGSGHGASDKTQRNLLEGDVWPGSEIDAVSDRFIQFGVSTNPGTKFTVDTIGLYVGGAGGNGMRWRIEYSIDENFGNEVVLAEYLSATSNTMYAIEAMPMVEVPEEQTLYIRIYPWYKDNATGKTICLSNLYVGGVVTKTSGVERAESDNTIAYVGNVVKNASGKPLSVFNTAGVCVMRESGDADLSHLASGVYVVKCDNRVLKVLR